MKVDVAEDADAYTTESIIYKREVLLNSEQQQILQPPTHTSTGQPNKLTVPAIRGQ